MIDNRYVIWIRNGKVGGTSFNKAFSGVFTPNNFKGSGLISLTPTYGKIIEVHAMGIGYAMGVEEFKIKYPSIWNEAFKFILVRNPYDRWVSSWAFLPTMRNIKFNDLMKYDYSKMNDHHIYHMTLKQTKHIIENDKLNVDNIIKLENFNENYYTLCELLSINPTKLEKLRVSKHQSYQIYYDEETSNFVYNMFKEDFDYLEYDKNSWKIN